MQPTHPFFDVDSIRDIIQSYCVPTHQELAELPDSVMWQYRDECIRRLKIKQRKQREQVVQVCANIVYYKSKLLRRELMNVAHILDRLHGRQQVLQIYIGILHQINCTLRFFQPKQIRYLSKAFHKYEHIATLRDNPLVTKSLYITTLKAFNKRHTIDSKLLCYSTQVYQDFESRGVPLEKYLLGPTVATSYLTPSHTTCYHR